jgi:hypothetical protein
MLGDIPAVKIVVNIPEVCNEETIHRCIQIFSELVISVESTFRDICFK